MRGYEGTGIYQLGKRLAVSLGQERFTKFYNQYRKLGAMIYNYREAALEDRV